MFAYPRLLLDGTLCLAKTFMRAFRTSSNTYAEGHLPSVVCCYARYECFGEHGWMPFFMVRFLNFGNRVSISRI